MTIFLHVSSGIIHVLELFQILGLSQFLLAFLLVKCYLIGFKTRGIELRDSAENNNHDEYCHRLS